MTKRTSIFDDIIFYHRFDNNLIYIGTLKLLRIGTIILRYFYTILCTHSIDE